MAAGHARQRYAPQPPVGALRAHPAKTREAKRSLVNERCGPGKRVSVVCPSKKSGGRTCHPALKKHTVAPAFSARSRHGTGGSDMLLGVFSAETAQFGLCPDSQGIDLTIRAVPNQSYPEINEAFVKNSRTLSRESPGYFSRRLDRPSKSQQKKKSGPPTYRKPGTHQNSGVGRLLKRL